MTSVLDPCRVMEIPDSAASASQALTDLAPIGSNPGDAVPSRPKRKRAGWVKPPFVQHVWTSWMVLMKHVGNEKIPGCVGYMGDYFLPTYIYKS